MGSWRQKLRSQCPTRPPRICQKNPSLSQSHGTHKALTLRTQIENIGFNHMVVFCLLSDEVTIICFYKRNEDFLKKKSPLLPSTSYRRQNFVVSSVKLVWL